ncbi:MULTISPECIES: glycerate kinase [unclassified Marinobacterium]|uniref:glycerate kinase n=1 Tax=unclassified Marinobacterium TaxID=2644139 RepID=UPI001569F13F|nr:MULTISPECIES: glycerate kinase [unclassified Marinobacterium]NRP10809.1 Glycerate kinase [Marinobacterium sp. xm-g-48]NRP36731.1 Glycerate kinase [Marinobacterium sp. xm-d-579]NRP46630.1 Glycerate kinase [Marinobacterium sp. xm-d-543]NRP52427.1 Glycerate kinase [Marinobacterium sp. xm-v-242]NRP58164.1 Glycerate kinase [Marinobacterium sp. xm-d-510]
MKLVIAPDSFKESLDAEGVARAIAKGIESTLTDVDIHCVPVADGGEGTTEALIAATSGKQHTAEVTGPLGGSLNAIWGVLGHQEGVPLTAVVETAAASGLDKILPEQRDALTASTYGTGELILKALDQGARRIIMGLGGSATNDGGTGLLRALGAKFLDAAGHELAEGGAALADLDRIDLTGFDPRLAETEFLVACDVDNPLLGERGASAIFGPQKGATPEQVQQLDDALTRLADVSADLLGKDLRDRAGAGAAGGLGYALVQFLDARLAPGIDLVLEAVDFHKTLEGADLVITGEGRMDGQSLSGKTPVGVARWAKQHDLPVIALCGSIGEGAEGVHDVGIDALFSVVPGVCSLEEALANGAENLERTGAQIGRLLSLKTIQL